jgi:DNA-binding CsgD family transcriptional regulator
MNEPLSAFYWRENMAPITGRPEYRPRPPTRRKSAAAFEIQQRAARMAADGMATAEIARQIGCTQRYVQVLIAKARAT